VASRVTFIDRHQISARGPYQVGIAGKGLFDPFRCTTINRHLVRRQLGRDAVRQCFFQWIYDAGFVGVDKGRRSAARRATGLGFCLDLIPNRINTRLYLCVHFAILKPSFL